jgi:hypothetical protein
MKFLTLILCLLVSFKSFFQDLRAQSIPSGPIQKESFKETFSKDLFKYPLKLNFVTLSQKTLSELCQNKGQPFSNKFPKQIKGLGYYLKFIAELTQFLAEKAQVKLKHSLNQNLNHEQKKILSQFLSEDLLRASIEEIIFRYAPAKVLNSIIPKAQNPQVEFIKNLTMAFAFSFVHLLAREDWQQSKSQGYGITPLVNGTIRSLNHQYNPLLEDLILNILYSQITLKLPALIVALLNARI